MDADLRAAVLKVAEELTRQIDLITYYRDACQGNKTIGWCPNIAMHDGAVAGLGSVFYDLVQGARTSAELIEEAEKEAAQRIINHYS